MIELLIKNQDMISSEGGWTVDPILNNNNYKIRNVTVVERLIKKNIVQ